MLLQQKPTKVYYSFQQQCNPYELGDATRAMSMILKKIRSVFANVDETATNDATTEAKQTFRTLYDLLFGGSMQQELMGRQSVLEKNGDNHNESTTSTNQQQRMRRKRKLITLPCPFPLDGLNCDSFTCALQTALEPTTVKGYKWDGNRNNYEEWTETGHTNTKSSSDWHTTKQLSFHGKLPIYLLFHLGRFKLENGRMKASANVVDVPLTMTLKSHHGDENETGASSYTPFKLMGGILHADEGDKDDMDYEGGHYIAICRQDQSSSDTWCLINDERVRTVSESQALDLLAGRPETLSNSFSMRGNLLIYAQSEPQQITTTQALQTQFQQSMRLAAELGCSILPTTIKTNKHEERPEDLVGRRLRVQWAKGKFYPGKVTSYNPSTGKHSVEYDDGDVREYRLHKKTIEWEE